MPLVPDPQRIIREIESSRRGEHVARLAAAAEVSGDLQEVGDIVLDHFVEEARRAGLAWSQIGAELGVSKQAAQQRFPDVARMAGPDCSEIERLMTPKAKRSIRAAHREARRLGCGYVGSEHLLLGILRTRRALAGRILEDLGVKGDDITAALERCADRRRRPDSGSLTTEAAQCLLESLDNARSFGHNYVGTEHILLGILHTPSSASGVLKDRGITYGKARRAATVLLSV